MAWRLAGSLIQLRKELDAYSPNRSKISDGSIGDAAHSSRTSDHNPNSAGVVCAIDITNGSPLAMEQGFQYLVKHPHPSQTYLIFNWRIASKTHGWRIRQYTGSNGHTKHMHVSASHDYDNTSKWNIAAAYDLAPTPTPEPEEEMTPAIVYTPTGQWVFVRGVDEQLYGKKDSGEWKPFGGRLTSGPDAEWNGSNIGVVVRGQDEATWQVNISDDGTVVSGLGWRNLGGLS